MAPSSQPWLSCVRLSKASQLAVVSLQVAALSGLVEARKANALAQQKPANFDEWILRVMGDGIANLFMRPYNFKVWAIPTHLMQAEWLGERVATVDVDRAITNVIQGKEDAGWGPNAVFRCGNAWGTVASGSRASVDNHVLSTASNGCTRLAHNVWSSGTPALAPCGWCRARLSVTGWLCSCAASSNSQVHPTYHSNNASPQVPQARRHWRHLEGRQPPVAQHAAALPVFSGEHRSAQEAGALQQRPDL